MLFIGCSDNTYDPSSDDVAVDELNAKDSAAIRAILDTNGMRDKQVRDVIELENGTAAKLMLDSIALTRFTITGAFDSCADYLELSITNCPLETLTIADTVRIPLAIMINQTKLKRIPDDIVRLRGRMSLYLSRNDLNAVSPAIMRCNVRDLDVDNNSLCALPDSLKNWITLKSLGNAWISTQRCGR